jgi:hypothetical protein
MHSGPEDAYTQEDGKFRVWFTTKFTHWYTTDTSGVNTAALIAHELSHEVSDLTGPGTGTDDVVDGRCTGDVQGRCYGMANVTYLAKNHPDQAVKNADNYGLYVVAPYTR